MNNKIVVFCVIFFAIAIRVLMPSLNASMRARTVHQEFIELSESGVISKGTVEARKIHFTKMFGRDKDVKFILFDFAFNLDNKGILLYSFHDDLGKQTVQGYAEVTSEVFDFYKVGDSIEVLFLQDRPLINLPLKKIRK